MRGRPFKSQVRLNIEEILATIGMGYGYQIHKIYKKTYDKTTLRNIYYHLHAGIRLREFVETGSEEGKGDYTWGVKVERKLYSLGPNANKERNPKVEEAMQELSMKYNDPGKKLEWPDIARKAWKSFSKDIEKAKSQADKKRLMEEYGRIRAWLGKHDEKKEREKIEEKLNSIM